MHKTADVTVLVPRGVPRVTTMAARRVMLIVLAAGVVPMAIMMMPRMMVQRMRASDRRDSKQESQSKRQCRNNKLHKHVSTWYAKHLQCKTLAMQKTCNARKAGLTKMHHGGRAMTVLWNKRCRGTWNLLEQTIKIKFGRQMNRDDQARSTYARAPIKDVTRHTVATFSFTALK
jgi:hypothetical protein